MLFPSPALLLIHTVFIILLLQSASSFPTTDLGTFTPPTSTATPILSPDFQIPSPEPTIIQPTIEIKAATSSGFSVIQPTFEHQTASPVQVVAPAQITSFPPSMSVDAGFASVQRTR
ncbi:hypothetical protein BC829DRAFT_405797 [Chytridium lagenaria]|nr:hypothetical protein BC829DRAFT_405797 [Chytridium lagenaria]